MDERFDREFRKGYALCGEPRCGSTCLARLCASTGLLGHPREYFAGSKRVRSANANPDRHLDRWIEQTTTPNGVYALKIFAEQFALVERSRWAERLPRLRFVHIQRRDMLAQSISLVKARQTGVFIETQAAQHQPRYSRRAIASALEQLAFNQARWSCWFARNGVEPVRLTYEHIAQAPDQAVESIAKCMNIEVLPPTEPLMAIQRDQLSQEWRERFLTESRDFGSFDYPSEGIRPWLNRLRSRLR